MAVLREAVRAGEPRRPGADDGDALARRRGALEGLLAMLHEMVGGVALQHADLDRLVLGEVPHAGLLAERFHRADARAHAAQDVGGEDRLRSPVGIVRLDLADEQRDVDRGRAGLRAGRIEAEIAAIRFHMRFMLAERRVEIAEAGGIFVAVGPPGKARSGRLRDAPRHSRPAKFDCASMTRLCGAVNLPLRRQCGVERSPAIPPPAPACSSAWR